MKIQNMTKKKLPLIISVFCYFCFDIKFQPQLVLSIKKGVDCKYSNLNKR